MSVYSYLVDLVSRGKVHLTLIDPDKQSPEDSGIIASIAEECGTDGIMVGGSTGLTMELVDKTIERIKENVSVPVIIFPSGAEYLSGKADAIFFMSFLNSTLRRFLIEEQVKGAIYVKKLGLEAIPMGYIVVEPGMTVGKVGKAELIRRDDYITAVKYSLAAQYLGMKLVYLEAGSGAPQPVPEGMVSEVRKNIDIPLIVGGGIRDGDKARKLATAGADIIVTGTIVEESKDIEKKLRSIILALKSA